MRKIVLLFSETALELIPQELQSDRMIQEEARKRHLKPESMILDSNKHFIPMRSLKNHEKRGRPDILHFSLLTALESLANKQKLVGCILVHTQNDDLLEFSPETRLPRNYSRFVGIMEQLLSSGKSTDLIKITKNAPFESALGHAIGGEGDSTILFFNELGEMRDLSAFSKLLSMKLGEKTNSPIVFVFGCFPHGTFSSGIRGLLLSKDAAEIRFGDGTLAVWTLAGIALDLYGLEAGL